MNILWVRISLGSKSVLLVTFQIWIYQFTDLDAVHVKITTKNVMHIHNT